MVKAMQFGDRYSYPFYFYVLKDGSWLIHEDHLTGAKWFNVPNLVPFISGYSDEHEVHIDKLPELQAQIVAKIDMGIRYSEMALELYKIKEVQ